MILHSHFKRNIGDGSACMTHLGRQASFLTNPAVIRSEKKKIGSSIAEEMKFERKIDSCQVEFTQSKRNQQRGHEEITEYDNLTLEHV